MSGLPAEVLDDVRSALGARGLEVEGTELVSPLGVRKGARWAFRVTTRDGVTLKARHLGSAAAAAQLRARREGLEHAFGPVLDRSGAVLVEEWIGGTDLVDAGEGGWIEPAGALLGRLHATPLGDEGGWADTSRWAQAAEADLDTLAATGATSRRRVDGLRDRVVRLDPGRARLVLAHVDFCADNMIVDLDGALRVIDNEQITVAPAGYDLGRTFHLWPMDDAGRARFRRGYASAVPHPPEAPEFWNLVAALIGVRVFSTRSPRRFAETVDLLERLAEPDSVGGGS